MSSFFAWCRRYVSLFFVVILLLFIYVLFFQDNSYGRLTQLNRQISELDQEIKENNDTAAYYHALNRRLNEEPAEMERIAREYYHMQAPNEDVYIVR